MNRSYVGVVTSQGLSDLYAEDGHVGQFVSRRVYRKRPYTGICCWVVLPDEPAELVRHHLQLAENELALRTLQAHAVHYGLILPSQYQSLEECCSSACDTDMARS